MLEVFFFLSLLMSYDGGIVGQFSIAALTLEECQEVHEKFVEDVVPQAEEIHDAYSVTTDCIRLLLIDEDGTEI